MATPSPTKRIIARLLILAVLFGVVWFIRHRQQAAQQLPAHTPAPATQSGGGQAGTDQQNTVPRYALDVLQYVRRNGYAPDNFVGGREFMNKEKRLPLKAPDGARIRYSEWDVHPKVQGQNRGPERLITGSDHSAWYTKDHYKTFQKID